MTTQTAQRGKTTSRPARIAVWVLVILTGVLTAIHLAGIFFIADGDEERLMFTCYTALNALSLVVLLGPLREGQPWAWAASWIQILATALVVPIAGIVQYLAFAAVMAVCLLVARPTAKP